MSDKEEEDRECRKKETPPEGSSVEENNSVGLNDDAVEHVEDIKDSGLVKVSKDAV